MKITSLNQKTSIEVQENDLLIIEDEEDTKQITVGEFINAVNRLSQEKLIRMELNEMIDRICDCISSAKYIFPEDIPDEPIEG